MGLFDRIKKAFDKGGVDIEIDAPDNFRWADGILPVGVRLSSEAEEERRITALEFSLGEDMLLADHSDESPSERRRRTKRAEKEALKYEHKEPFTLAPGEVVTLDIEFPLSLDGMMDQLGAGDDAPEWLSLASDAMNLLKDATRDEQWFRLKVRPQVEGFTAAKVANRRIRNLRTGEFGGKNWTATFNT